MAKKKREIMENEIVLDEEVFAITGLEAPVEETVLEKPEEPKAEPVAPKKEKKVVLPILPITEVARQFKAYKKYHDAALLSFCASTGMPTEGTEPEMKIVLKKFGW
jgi:hypothetical protein